MSKRTFCHFPLGRSWQAPAGSNGAGLLRPLHCLGLFGGSEPKTPPWAARENRVCFRVPTRSFQPALGSGHISGWSPSQRALGDVSASGNTPM